MAEIDFSPTEGAAQREFERYKFDQDMAQRKRESEIAAKAGLKLTAAQATVIGAVLTVFSGLIGGLVQRWSSVDTETVKSNAGIKLERQKFETSLINKAIATPSRLEQIANLHFYVAAGFISDPDNKIMAMKEEEYPRPTFDVIKDNKISLNDPVFSKYPATLIEILKKYEGPAADPAALDNASQEVKRNVTAAINANQEAALISLVYNIGSASFRGSSLLKIINEKKAARLTEEFERWSKIGSRTNAALLERRDAEAQLFDLPVL